MNDIEKIRESIEYQVQLIRDISKVDMIQALDVALRKIELLETLVADFQDLFELSMSMVSAKEKFISHLQRIYSHNQPDFKAKERNMASNSLNAFCFGVIPNGSSMTLHQDHLYQYKRLKYDSFKMFSCKHFIDRQEKILFEP